MRSASALLLTSIMLLLLAPGAAAQRNASETHIVRPGETLGLIAQAYGVSMDELAAENGIVNAHLIHSWQLLTIPLGPSTEENSTTVHVARPGATLHSIADAYDMNLFEFPVLNRNNRGRLYPGERLALHLPERDSDAIRPAAETALATEALVHIVKAGESLSKIAEAYGVTLQELQAENGLYSWLIHPGLELRIPAGGKPPAPQSETDLQEEEPAAAPEAEIESAPEPGLKASEYVHIVRHGEALGKIAEAYGVSLDDLHALNELSSWMIHPGQKLLIPEGGAPPAVNAAPAAPAAPTAQDAPPVSGPDTHVVQRGETLFRIARKYGLSLDTLMAANGIADPSRIHSGLTLRVRNLEVYAPPAASTQVAATRPAAPAPAEPRKQYVVKSGEILSQIGLKLGINWRAFVDVNDIPNPNSIYAGMVLQIPTAAEAAKYGPLIPAVVAPGARVGVGREFVVVLGTQRAYAYEDGVLKHTAVISSGLPDTPTVTGDFKIRLKVRSQTMSGFDYRLENVEWVMYFYSGYAFHGTWWHNNFGRPMSRGCVNMTIADAKWFYEFGEIGTPVYVRD